MTTLQKIAFHQLVSEKVEAMETLQELRDFIEVLRSSEMEDFAEELENTTLPAWEKECKASDFLRQEREFSQGSSSIRL